MSEALTHSLAAFVSDLRLTAVPADALTVVHTGFADCIGTMIAGSIEDPPNILRKVLASAQAMQASTSPVHGSRRRMQRGSTAPLRTRWTMTTWPCAAIPARCWCPPSWLRESRSVQAGPSWQPPTSRATRCGPSWPRAIPHNTTRRAGIRPASSVPSARRQRVPLCAAWIETGRRTQLRSAPRTALAWWPISAP